MHLWLHLLVHLQMQLGGATKQGGAVIDSVSRAMYLELTADMLCMLLGM